MVTKKKFKDYEAAVNRLEEITAMLENGEISLEESIDLYSEGLEIAKECNSKLSEAEKKIKIIMEKSGIETEEDFNEEDLE